MTTTTTDRPRRIVLTTFGSLGDLHPYLDLARKLQSRGHEAIIATTRHYQERVESRGIGFRAVRPDGPDLASDPEPVRRIMDQRRGGEYVIRQIMMPALRESYADTVVACAGADLLVSHVLTFTTRLVAEKTGIPWASTFLQPLGFFSAYDPPVLPQLPLLEKVRGFGPGFHRFLFGLAKRTCVSWCEPWHRLRSEIGLPPTTENPVFEGLYSPDLVLALFSPAFADKQPDWPAQTVVSGFPLPASGTGTGLSAEIRQFLEAGSAPIVFTLGSSGVVDSRPFFEASAAAAQRLGRRGILVLGEGAERPAHLPEGILAVEYVPFADLFPRAAAIVHAGGVGTTSLAMRAGRPMLVMPLAHDQFDNGARITRLGIGHTISRHRYTPVRVASALRRLLENEQYAREAEAVGAQIQREDGLETACRALEQLLDGRPPQVTR